MSENNNIPQTVIEKAPPLTREKKIGRIIAFLAARQVFLSDLIVDQIITLGEEIDALGRGFGLDEAEKELELLDKKYESKKKAKN